jgi:DHA1 family multidrug resistance protein-like MFS transporter
MSAAPGADSASAGGPHSDSGAPCPNGKKWFLVVLPVAAIAACAELGTAILNNSTLPVYFNMGLGLSTALMSVLMVPFFISEALFKSPLGVLADEYGRKPFILFGTLMTVFTPLVLTSIRYDAGSPTAPTTLLAFAFLRLLDGLGGAAMWPALYAYIGDRVEVARRGAAMGLLNVVYMIGLALSFMVGGDLDDQFGAVFAGRASIQERMRRLSETMRAVSGPHHFGHRFTYVPSPGAPDPTAALKVAGHYFPSFYATSVLFAIASIICVIAVPNRRPREHGATGERIDRKEFLRCMRLIPQYMLLAFITFLGIGNLPPIVKVFAINQFHMSEPQLGTVMLWTALIIAAAAYPLGHLGDVWGRVRSVRLGFVLCAVGLWGIPLLYRLHVTSDLGFVVSAAVMGMGFVIAFPAWNALLTTLTDENRRGTVVGAVAAAQGVGVLIGYMLGGNLYTVAPIAPFVACAALVTCGASISLFAIREPQRAPE